MAFDNLNVFVILSATSMEFVVVRLIAVFSIPLQTPLSGVMGGRRWELMERRLRCNTVRLQQK